jgi:hypothetical protein
MRKKFIIVLGVLTLLVLILIVSFVTLTRETENWDFIQKVGGIKIETPLETEDGFYLPVVCNVSGLDSVTIKPTTLNSALSCLKIKSTINGNAVHLKVVAGLAVFEKPNCNCKAVRIGDLEPGKYIVYYGDKSSFEHPIGKFTIE